MEITNLNLIDVWKDRIKEHEGFRLEPYNLSYGNVTESFQTGGYGHRIIPGEEIPTTKEGWEKVFNNLHFSYITLKSFNCNLVFYE